MKTFPPFRIAAFALGLIAAATMLQSCDDDPSPAVDDYRVFGLVTVRPNSNESFSMQLNDSTTLTPLNMKASPFGSKEVRALSYFTVIKPTEGSQWKVNVWRLDSVRTKQPVASTGTDDDRLYGNDPVEIVKSWMTVAEDGYLTLRIRTRWGSGNTMHYVNLLTGTNKDNAYELELRHNAQGDTAGRMGDALVAFDLHQLPKSADGKAKIRLTWQSFSGKKSAEFMLSLKSEAQPMEGSLEQAADDDLVQGGIE